VSAVLELSLSEAETRMPGSPASVLGDLIERRKTAIGIIGMGYVGLPLAKALVEQHFTILGFDIDTTKVKTLNAGRSYIKHIPPETIASLRSTGRFSVTSNFGRLSDLNIILICVPTPLNRHREPDLSFIVATAQSLKRYMRRGQLIVLESTTYPGTTLEILRPILETSGLKSGVDFFLAYSPEREDPGNPDFATAGIPKVVGGDGPEATKLSAALYGLFVRKVVPVSSVETAEAIKLTENIFRAVNIALVNELKLVYEAMGIDIWEVVEAAKTKPFGYMPFYPGPGLGGHCIPVDPFYLTWKAREFNIATQFIELAGQINNSMPCHVVDRLAKALDQRAYRGLNGAKILLIGLAYKKNVDDMRESPSLKLIELIEERGARVDYYDPMIPIVPGTREYRALEGRRSIPWDPALIRSYDAVVIATDHDGIDYGTLALSAKLVIDTRNAMHRAGVAGGRVVKA
jgi:UDP-N-acetyl-D-glucosamine dehydrogenase